APSTSLFPYSTLFRSDRGGGADHGSQCPNSDPPVSSIGHGHRHHKGPLQHERGCPRTRPSPDLPPGATNQSSTGGHRRPLARPRSEEHTSELQSRENL